MVTFLKAVFTHFSNSNTFQKGASLAYYAVFSLLPMIMIVTSVLGIIWGEKAVSGEIYTQFSGVLGDDAANQIQELIKNQHKNHNSFGTAIIGFITLALSASGMFIQVHNALNSIWGVKAKPKSSILNYAVKHFTSFSILILLFFLLLGSVTLNSLLLKYEAGLHPRFNLFYLYEHLVSIVVLSLVFAILFKFLTDAIIHWKAALLGGLFTALFFTVGKIGVGMYIGHSNIASTFGAASVLALLMVWVYYTSQIIFLGASFVKVVSDKLGYEIVPGANAVAVQHVEVQS